MFKITSLVVIALYFVLSALGCTFYANLCYAASHLFFNPNFEHASNSEGRAFNININSYDSIRPVTKIQFDAFRQSFDAILSKNSRLFLTREVTSYIHKKAGDSIQMFWEPEYSGYLTNQLEPSFVLGSIVNDTFQGTIRTDEHLYIIEPIFNDNIHNAKVRKLFINVSNFIENNVLPTENHLPLTRPDHKRTCTLRLVLDSPMKDISISDYMALASELQFIMDLVDRIFASSDFDGDGIADGVGFEIKNIDIYEEGRLFNETITSLTFEEYLNEAKFIGDFADVCAGLVFTHRFISDFLSDNWQIGGICNKNLNVRVIPLDVFAKVTLISSALFTAHQLGHLFGSHHDDVTANGVFYPNDKYIMAPGLISGTSVSNYRFSSNSLAQISSYINENGNCLTYDDESRFDHLTPLTGPPPTFSSDLFYQTSIFPEYAHLPNQAEDEVVEEIKDENLKDDSNVLIVDSNIFKVDVTKPTAAVAVNSSIPSSSNGFHQLPIETALFKSIPILLLSCLEQIL